MAATIRPDASNGKLSPLSGNTLSRDPRAVPLSSSPEKRDAIPFRRGEKPTYDNPQSLNQSLAQREHTSIFK